MNLKNKFLGLVALLISVGAAFASITIVTPDYIHVRYAGDATFTCTVATTCEGTGVPCRVNIIVQGVVRSTPVYDDQNPTQCSVALQGESPIAQFVSKQRTIVAAD